MAKICKVQPSYTPRLTTEIRLMTARTKKFGKIDLLHPGTQKDKSETSKKLSNRNFYPPTASSSQVGLST
jgi:hypothetical protein